MSGTDGISEQLRLVKLSESEKESEETIKDCEATLAILRLWVDCYC